jgi:hypothetical protein
VWHIITDVSEEHAVSVCSEEGGNKFLQNVDDSLPDQTASYLRRQ